MCFNSLLLVAVFFAGFHSSSTRSMSTSVNITEERTLDFSALGESVKESSSKVPKVAEEMTKLSSPARLRKRKKPDEISQPYDFDTILRSWIHQPKGQSPYLRIILPKHPEMIKGLAREVFSRLEDKRVSDVVDALKVANVDKKTRDMIEDVMIEYWKEQKKSPLDVFQLLRLDRPDLKVIPQVYNPAEVKRFKMWMKFTTEKPDRSIVDVCRDIPFGLVLMILDGLRLIKDTQNVEIMEIVLVHRLPFGISFAEDTLTAFRWLALGKSLNKLLTHPNLKVLNMFVKTRYPEDSKEEALVMAASQVYGRPKLREMLFAASQKVDGANAKLLLKIMSR